MFVLRRFFFGGFLFIAASATASSDLAWQNALTAGPDWERVRILAQAGQQPDVVRATDGKTALYLAIEQGKGTEVRVLLTAGAKNRRVGPPPGKSPFSLALERGLNEEADLIYSVSSEAELASELRSAILSGEESTVSALLKKGLSATVLIGVEQPLHLAARRGVPSIVRALLEAKADPNSQSAAGRTPLLEAMRSRPETRTQIMDLLIAAGATVNQVGSSGEPPLVIAVRSRSIESVERLLNGGASVADRSPSLKCRPLRCMFVDERSFSPTIAYHLLKAAIQQGRWPL